MSRQAKKARSKNSSDRKTPKKATASGRAKASQQTQGTARRTKGEQTRRKILEATLIVIAEHGVRGVTHRAVAATADVQLSLTTYYFKDINDLLREAFALFCEEIRPELDATWKKIFNYLDKYSATELRKIDVREKICDYLARVARDYIVTQIIDKPVGLAVEQSFFTEARLTPELHDLAQQHRQNLLEPFLTFVARFNKTDPEIDADLLLDTITRLEYQALTIPKDQIDRQYIYRLVKRQIGWTIGLKQA